MLSPILIAFSPLPLAGAVIDARLLFVTLAMVACVGAVIVVARVCAASVGRGPQLHVVDKRSASASRRAA